MLLVNSDGDLYISFRLFNLSANSLAGTSGVAHGWAFKKLGVLGIVLSLAAVLLYSAALSASISPPPLGNVLGNPAIGGKGDVTVLDQVFVICSTD